MAPIILSAWASHRSFNPSQTCECARKREVRSGINDLLLSRLIPSHAYSLFLSKRKHLMNQYHNFHTAHALLVCQCITQYSIQSVSEAGRSVSEAGRQQTWFLAENQIEESQQQQQQQKTHKKAKKQQQQRQRKKKETVHEAFIVCHYIYNKRVVNMIFSVCVETRSHRDTTNVIFQ